MPVKDHEVHGSTIKATELNGCHTMRRKEVRKKEYQALDRIYDEETRGFHVVRVWVQDRGSTGCRNYYLWDKGCCEGCLEPKDLEYRDEMVRVEEKEGSNG